MDFVSALGSFLRAVFRDRAGVAENLALRHQPGVL